MANEAPVTLDRKLWLTEDRDELVEHGDPKARFLFGVAGRRMNGAECKRVGYRPDSKIAADDETAQTVSSDAEKQAANELESLKVLAAEGDDDAKTALAMLDAETKALRGKAKARVKAKADAVDKAAKAEAAKEAKKLADKERKKGSNKGSKKGGK